MSTFNKSRRWVMVLVIDSVPTTTLILLFILLITAVPRHRTAQHTRQRNLQQSPVTFHGFDLQYHTFERSMYSSVHCVGENFGTDAWIYRSCQFRNICYDTDQNEFILFPSPEETALQAYIIALSNEFVTVNSVADSSKTVSLGMVHDPWAKEDQMINEWSPKIIMGLQQQKDILRKGFYEFRDETVLFPVRHTDNDMQWKQLFSIYSALSTFGLEKKQIIPMIIQKKGENHSKNIASYFWQLLGVPTSFSDDNNLDHSFLSSETQSNIICSKFGAAGIGSIALSRIRASAYSNDFDYMTHATHRGALFHDFRDYLLYNLGVADHGTSLSSSLSVVTVYEDSKIVGESALPTSNQVQSLLEREIPGKLKINIISTETTNIVEQARLLSSSASLIWLSDPTTLDLMALLMPKGSSVITFDRNRNARAEANWELIQSMGYVYFYNINADNNQVVTLRRIVEQVNLTLQDCRMNNCEI